MNHSEFTGRAIALIAAIFYGFNTTLSRLAYDTGTTPISLTFYRFLISTLLIALVLMLLRKQIRISVKPLIFILNVIGLFAISIGHLGAVNYIPVSLSAIIFYTFPLQVLAWKRIVNCQQINVAEWISFILAFVGIGIALGPEFNQVNPIGIMLAVIGSIGSTVFILSYEKFPKETDPWVGTFWITLSTLVLALVTLQFGFELKPPVESVGWIYLLLIAGVSLAAFLLTLYIIPKIGAGPFAMVMNFEPVVILVLAWLVIGEELTTGRIIGMSLVVLALFLSHWRPVRSHPA